MFFILTTGRSGSKSISEYLSNSAEIFCPHEPEPALIFEATDYLYGKFKQKELVEILRRTRQEIVDGKQYGESNNKLAIITPAIIQAFPNCKFIWLIRVGRDVVDSFYSIGWYDPSVSKKTDWDNTAPEAPIIGLMGQDKWDALGVFGKCCWYWTFINETIERDMVAVEKNKWLRVRLEDLDQEKRKDELTAFLGASPLATPFPWTNIKARKKEKLGWANWTENQKDIFTTICGQMMDRVYPEWRSPQGQWQEVISVPTGRKMQNRAKELMLRIVPPGGYIYTTARDTLLLVADKKRLMPLKRFYRKITGMD